MGWGKLGGDVYNITEENATGVLYIVGDDETEGSIRITIDEVTGNTILEKRTDDIWAATTLELGSDSLLLGKQVGIAGIGHHLATELPDGHYHLLAHSHFDGEETDGESRMLFAYNYEASRAFQPDFSTTFIGTNIEFGFTGVGHVMTKNIHYKTGGTVPTTPVRIRIYEGTDDTGILVFDQSYPPASFPADSDIELAYRGFVEYEDGTDYFLKYSCATDFSLKANAGTTVVYFAADIIDLREDNILQTAPWVDGATYTEGDLFIDSRKIYHCNVTGVQTGNFASNSAKWDLGNTSEGYSKWDRTGTTLSPKNTGDDISTTGDISAPIAVFGALTVSKAAPEIRLTNTGSNEYSRIIKNNVTNEATRFNKVLTHDAVISGLVSQWKMNDNLATNVVLDNVGTNHGALTDSTNTEDISVAGKIDQALDLSNSTTLHAITTDSTFTNGWDKISFAIWINLDSVVDYSGLIFAAEGTQSLGLQFWDNNKVVIWVNGSGGRKNVTTEDGDIPTGEWVHIVGTWSQGNAPKIYVNGELKATGSTPMTDVILQPDVFKLGMDDNNNFRSPDGRLDDIRIYNAELSQGEIDGIYNAGAGTEENIIDVVREIEVWSSKDGVTATEEGIHTFGTLNGSTIIQGQSITANGALTATLSPTSILDDGVIGTTQSLADNSTKLATTAYVDESVEAEDLWKLTGEILQNEDKSSRLVFHDGTNTRIELDNDATAFFGPAGIAADRIAIDSASIRLNDGTRDRLYQESGKTALVSPDGTKELSVTNTGVVAEAQYIYLGDPDTDGSWRIRINGTALAFERRASGSYSQVGAFD